MLALAVELTITSTAWSLTAGFLLEEGTGWGNGAVRTIVSLYLSPFPSLLSLGGEWDCTGRWLRGGDPDPSAHLTPQSQRNQGDVCSVAAYYGSEVEIDCS